MGPGVSTGLRSTVPLGGSGVGRSLDRRGVIVR